MSTSISLRNTLITLMKDVSDGLQLDSAERYEDAYRKYLECLLRITTTLLKKLHNEGGHLKISTDLCKTVKLGQQCMDRVSAIISEKYENIIRVSNRLDPDEARVTQHLIWIQTVCKVPYSEMPKRPADNMSLPLTSPTTPLATPTTPSPRGVMSTRVSLSNTPSPSVERYNTYIGSQGQQRDDRPVLRTRSGEKLTPMALASRQNQQLLLAFKSRQAQAQKRRNLSMSTNLSLTLQRKMAENLAIAKAQEEALAKKMLERQARLEEQAARRFGTPVGLSEEEQQQRQIYRRVLQFELEQPHMQDVKTRFEENPTDIELISHLLSAVLRCDSHPLTEQLKQFQDKVLDKLQPMVCNKIPDVENIKVPLSEDLYEKFKVKLKQYAKDETIDGPSEISSEIEKLLDDENKENECNYKDDQEKSDNEKMEFGNEGNWNLSERSKSDSSVEVRSDIVTVVENVKKDVETAQIKGEKLRKELEEENESMKSLALYTAGEYDKYNQENMDDLFDDDDDEDDEELESNAGQDDSLEETKPDPEKTESDQKSSLRSYTNELDELKIEAYKRHLKGFVEDILTSVEQLAVLFVVVYDKLDSAEGKDQCNAELEASFFRPLWKYLLVLFRLSNASEELRLAGIMTDKQVSDPALFNVRDKLCLTPSTQEGSYPYEAAITELLSIVTFHTMLEKLECIVRTSKLVLQCVEQYYTDQNASAPSMGADDLVPVLCYVVVRSGLPQIVSECQAVEKFLHEGYMFGEEGYCLTSFQTAIDYLTSERCLVKS